MDDSLKTICDQYIEHCQKVLLTRDSIAARDLRLEATLQFHQVVPRWQAGLMAGVTQYYLDDIETILNKLLAFRQSLTETGDRRLNRTTSHEAARYHKPLRHIDSFDQVCTWVRDAYAANASEKAEVLSALAQLQKIALTSTSSDEKWIQVQGYLDWLHNKNAELAAHLLPLFGEVLGA